jgi:uncharacterized protein (UPF0332 family)
VTDASAREALALARRKAQSALELDSERHPGVVVHEAYYAMFHAARAWLIAVDGTTPYRHLQVRQRFALLADERGEPAMLDLAQALRLASDLREAEDYGALEELTAAEAVRLRERACAFVRAAAMVVRDG